MKPTKRWDQGLSDDQVHHRRVGMRWGRAVERMTLAREAIHEVRGIKDLLSADLYERVQDLANEIASLELDIWDAECQSLAQKVKVKR